NATRGFVRIRDFMQLVTEDKTNTSSTPVILIDISSARTFTLSDAGGGFTAGNAITALGFASTVVFTTTPGVLSLGALFSNTGVFKNASSLSSNWSAFVTLSDQPTVTADTTTFNGPNWITVVANPTFTRTNSGVMNVTNLD